MAKAKQSSTKAKAKTTTNKQPLLNKVKVDEWLKSLFYGVWALVGLLLLIGIVLYAFNVNLPGNFSDTTNDSSTTGPTAAQQKQQQQAQAQQEKILQCTKDKIGDKRLEKLQNGEQPTEKENAIVQKCAQEIAPNP